MKWTLKQKYLLLDTLIYSILICPFQIQCVQQKEKQEMLILTITLI